MTQDSFTEHLSWEWIKEFYNEDSRPSGSQSSRKGMCVFKCLATAVIIKCLGSRVEKAIKRPDSSSEQVIFRVQPLT